MNNNNISRSQKSSILPYIIAIIVMSLIAVVAVLMISMMRPDADNTILIATILGFTATMTTSIMSLLKSQETHVSVNSRMDQWKEDVTTMLRAEGAADAVAREQDRVAAIAKEKMLYKAVQVVIESPPLEHVAAPVLKLDTSDGPIPVQEQGKKI